MLVKVANSPRTLVALAILALLLASVGYSTFEHKGLDDAVWWAMITGSTVGYGDAYPKSTPGRAIAVILVGTMVIFFIPMVTASMASRLIVDRNAFTDDEQEEVKGLLRRIAAMEDAEITHLHVKMKAADQRLLEENDRYDVAEEADRGGNEEVSR